MSKFCMHSLSPHTSHIPSSSSSPRFTYSDVCNPLISFSLRDILKCPLSSDFLRQNMPLRTLFSNICFLWSLLKFRYHFSQSYKVTFKNILCNWTYNIERTFASSDPNNKKYVWMLHLVALWHDNILRLRVHSLFFSSDICSLKRYQTSSFEALARWLLWTPFF
jgi:hypothetical protein